MLALVPVVAGLSGVFDGVGMFGPAPAKLPDGLDSHFRYLSGLLLAIGVGYWSTLPRLPAQGPRFRLLTALVVTGGLARLLGALAHGWPPAPMMFGLVMELVVTPALCLWQARLARLQRGGKHLSKRSRNCNAEITDRIVGPYRS